MKKIINGKRYDTDTAKKIGGYQYRYPSDFSWFRETLYKKTTGEFFLHGEGGAKTLYRENIDNNAWRGGEKLIPLTVKSAMEWAEKNLSVDEYEEIFGEVSEDGEMPGKTQISFWVTDGQKKQADSLHATHAEIYTAGLKALAK